MLDETIKRDLNRLVMPGEQKTPLAQAKTPVPIAESKGFSGPKQPKNTGTGSIASPLTVTGMSGVSSMTMVSTDGFFVLNLPLQVEMTDAKGSAVRVKFPE